MKKKITSLDERFHSALKNADSDEALESVRIQYLGRKGELADLFQAIGTVPESERREIGRLLNATKTHLLESFEKASNALQNRADNVETVDLTLPGDRLPLGSLHPLTQVTREIKSCFQSMGFTVAQGPEIETEYYNFDALNIPRGHPARDMQDTLFISEADEIVLRTHTSPVQIHVMENQSPPVRVIAPGRVYRRDTPDASHSPVFHQIEGLAVDEGINFADLKGTILNFAQRMFGSDMQIRFRPSFFPFTEPSAEYDFSCVICRGKGCRVCQGTGWIEISGAGMVNPAVYQYVHYDAEKYTGFAFGMGVERIAMLMYEINDIRYFYENDIRFLRQF
ncbi:phenylalanine--tRNA ligase subunit alpha [bacterium]|nr:phenylalanine--tRNA ligase subunit alpha [candidate division CSSED10-310 bacterium]